MDSVNTRVVDTRGRLSLGAAFAGKHVIITHESPTVVRIQMAAVVPENEAWLWNNPQALASVLTGIQQASAGEVAEPPDLKAGQCFADSIEEQ